MGGVTTGLGTERDRRRSIATTRSRTPSCDPDRETQLESRERRPAQCNPSPAAWPWRRPRCCSLSPKTGPATPASQRNRRDVGGVRGRRQGGSIFPSVRKKKKFSWVHGEISAAFSNSACAGQHQSGGQNRTPGAAKTRDRRPRGAGVRRSGRKAASYARPLSSRGRGADQAGEATATGQATPGPLV